MPTDALIQLQASTTKTSPFQGAALILAAGTPRRGLKARVIYSAASVASGTGTLAFSIDVSYDAGSTFTSLFFSPTLATSTTAISGELFIPFEISPTSVANGTQIRLSVNAITGTTPTVTYVGDISLTRP